MFDLAYLSNGPDLPDNVDLSPKREYFTTVCLIFTLLDIHFISMFVRWESNPQHFALPAFNMLKDKPCANLSY